MNIALVAPPFISVPPAKYGGTELFIAHLATGLTARGHRVTVYANGDSTVDAEVKWRYRHSRWPIDEPVSAQLENADHHAWAIADAAEWADVIHLNDIVGLPFTMFVESPVVLTVHHPHDSLLTTQYGRYPGAHYVAISAAQARRDPTIRTKVVHHGVELDRYTYSGEKENYLAFLGRMAPCKGAHLAIEVARRAGLPLKLAGEIQPVFRDYWEQQVAPYLGGDVEYIGEADLDVKNELLSRARALLFPIQWDEPFGLVMIEAMACGTPVLALPGGSVPEVVANGVSGWICRDVDEMVQRALADPVPPESCREWVTDHFSVDVMVERYLDVYCAACRGSKPATLVPRREAAV